MPPEQVFADRIAVIGFVGEQFVRWWRGVEHDGQHPEVGGLAG